MRPTRRFLVAVGRTWASAERTSSMRALELGMPRVWLPDVEPEASNTIMASSVQGDGFFSSAPAPERVHVSTAISAKSPSRKLLFVANRLAISPAIIAQSPEMLADFSARIREAKRFPDASWSFCHGGVKARAA